MLLKLFKNVFHFYFYVQSKSRCDKGSKENPELADIVF